MTVAVSMVIVVTDGLVQSNLLQVHEISIYISRENCMTARFHDQVRSQHTGYTSMDEEERTTKLTCQPGRLQSAQ